HQVIQWLSDSKVIGYQTLPEEENDMTAKTSTQTRREKSEHAATRHVERYDPSAIEPKWQARWAADRLYEVNLDEPKRKFYFLTMYPYPSGDLHIGHWYAMAPSDAGARYRRMQGYNVLFPMGFDAFGLPAENAAIKHGIHPYKWTMSNIANMRRQMRSMG